MLDYSLSADSSSTPSRDSHDKIRENILETVGKTPVVRINKLAPPNVNLYVKIEAFNPLGSVKDRLALASSRTPRKRARSNRDKPCARRRAATPDRASRWYARQKGYPLVVTMAESFSVERRRLMRFLGAKVILTPAPEGGTGMVKKANELAKKNGWFLTRQFENEANADYHSRTTAREIVNDFRRRAAGLLVTGFGTGGTLKGVGRVSGQGAARSEDHPVRARRRADGHQQDAAGTKS